MSTYDVCIVGGGPIGCYCAYCLRQNGFKVAVLEKNSEIASGVNCAGVIGVEAFEKFNLAWESIESRIYSLKFVGPGGNPLQFAFDEPLAFVVDRIAFDRYLANQAVSEGAEFIFNFRVERIQTEKGHVSFFDPRHPLSPIKAKVGIISTGFGDPLTQQLGLGRPPLVFQGAQVEIPLETGEATEIYLGKKIAPDSFAWVIPLGNGKARVGLSASKGAVVHLKRFLHGRFLKHRLRQKEGRPSISCSPIPCGAIPWTFAERLLVVGEAAGQLKTTTHGGIYYGLICAQCAAAVITEARQAGDFGVGFLKRYERLWRSKIAREINVGYYLRQLFSKFNDRQIDTLIEVGKKEEVASFLRQFIRFDWHRDLIISSLRFSFFRDFLRKS